MSVFVKAIEIYNKQGFVVGTGLNPYHFTPPPPPPPCMHLELSLPFTAFYNSADGNKYNSGGGIAPVEVYLIESLAEVFSPKNVYIIGNAFGWSTIVASLAFKDARIVALDAGIEGSDAMMGINLTNQIAADNKLNCLVEYGFSPEKTKYIVEQNFQDDKLDFVFIDGLHTNEQLLKDFKGLIDFCDGNTVYLFHDVINWKMLDSFKKIKQYLPEHDQRILYRTSSGMGAYIPKTANKSIVEVFDAFTEPLQNIVNINKSLTRFAMVKNLLYKFYGSMPSPVRKLAKHIKTLVSSP